MYAWHVDRNSVRAEMEAELLIELLMSWTVVLWGSLDSFDSVRGLDCRCSIWYDKAALYFRCQGCDVFLSAEGAFCVSIDYYNTMGSGHLEFR